MPRDYLPTVEINPEIGKRLREISKELRVSIAKIRRLALGNFVSDFSTKETFKKEVKAWFLKTTA